MKKDELKNILRPLIKECIKEVIFEEGTLSAIISEVVRGTSSAQPIVEVKKTAPPKVDQSNRRKADAMKQRKKKLLDSIGKEAYNGVNLFEGTTPTSSPQQQSRGALKDVDPGDAGVDISNIFSGHSSAIWKKLSGKNDV
tara:strand:+ start:500 stop:919 length:420 start_codon:yes stop_codon:yes gene_type:complete